jgi:hypothetical protein
MNQNQNTGERPVIPPDELYRRKHQLWLTAGLMVIGLCLSVVLLLLVFILFGDAIGQFLLSLR